MGSPQKEKSRRRPRFRIVRGRRRQQNALHRSASLHNVQEEPHDSPITFSSVHRSLSLSPSDSLREIDEFDCDDHSSTSTFVESEDSASLAAGIDPMEDLEGMVEELHQEADDPLHFHEAVELWMSDAQALAQSKELTSFVASGTMVFGQASHMALHVAMLPMSVPMNVLSHTSSLVCHALVTTTTAVDHALSTVTDSGNPIDAVVQTISCVAPLALQVVSQIKDELGSTLLGLLTAPMALLEDGPRLGSAQGSISSREVTSNDKSPSEFLDRLRLDYHTEESEGDLNDDDSLPSPEEDERPEHNASPRTSPRSSDVSKFILRVCDLGLSAEDSHGRNRSLHCIDLNTEFAVPELTRQALDELVARGLALICTNSVTRIGNSTSPGLAIDWKPENGTERHLKKRATLKSNDWIARLGKNVLVWSGKFRDRHAFPHGDVPLFLSRGILPMTPKELLSLFWDNECCHKYNKYCSGRTSLMTLEDDLDKNVRARGTKVVRAETQVPFTGLSVTMSTLMHARKVDTAEGPCYIILSRNVHPGKAGLHYGGHHHHTSNKKKIHSKSLSKNELLWGVNVIRSVPNHPNLSELTACSQIKSGLVPPFLTHRVGVMAVDNCFNALREL